MTMAIHEIDSVSILSLQDNYIDILVSDNDEIVQRPTITTFTTGTKPTITPGPAAEHGFSSFITVRHDGQEKNMLFDFGCSNNGAASNVDLLSVDLSNVSELALSHGHFDHFGGMKELISRLPKKDYELVAHPSVFKKNRFLKAADGNNIIFPELTREHVTSLGLSIKEAPKPVQMLGGYALFLGEIPRTTSFEQGMPSAICIEDGKEKQDIIEDDSSMIFNVKDKGLVVLSGCAHSGIVNTVRYAKEVTGIDDVYVIMGGFHLSGALQAPFIQPTIEALKEFAPKHIIPAHCTGRNATIEIEKAMPEEFILNMSGTTLTF